MPGVAAAKVPALLIERREQVSLDRKVGELQATVRFSETDDVGQPAENE
ncbi:hypothetical protein IFT68_23105 [Oxalobacteraceae sp. CFBP 13730]|nr:hypothetical protein [Oxalobacteraceae sp. CFBP 13730]